jgi:hypothetical protein
MEWATTLGFLFMRLCHFKPLLQFPLAHWRRKFLHSEELGLHAYTKVCPACPAPATGPLQLLARRIKAAQQLEKQEEAVRGLELLYRRWVGGQGDFLLGCSWLLQRAGACCSFCWLRFLLARPCYAACRPLLLAHLLTRTHWCARCLVCPLPAAG